jgi:hypothetical protein
MLRDLQPSDYSLCPTMEEDLCLIFYQVAKEEV